MVYWIFIDKSDTNQIKLRTMGLYFHVYNKQWIYGIFNIHILNLNIILDDIYYHD